jgi:hypothetical protein
LVFTSAQLTSIQNDVLIVATSGENKSRYGQGKKLFGSGVGSPVTARRSRLAALAARGVAEDFPTFQVSFVAPSRSRATAPRQKPAVTFAKVAVPFPKPAATSSKVTVTFPKVAATSGKVAIPFAKVAVTFRREIVTFASFSPKTAFFRQKLPISPISPGFIVSQNKASLSLVGQTCRSAGWRRSSTALPPYQFRSVIKR